MGQYYKPLLLDKQTSKPIGFFYSHEYGNGLKLMEHSYMENNFVNAVANYIIKLKGARVVWAGDYADAVENLDKEIFDLCVEYLKKDGEYYADKPNELKKKINEGFNYYEVANALESFNHDFKLYHKNQKNVVDRGYRFLVNETKKEYVDLCPLPNIGMTINPLPLLTAGFNTNGRGGGDYHGLSLDYVGRWCGDVINYQQEGKRYNDKPQGYTEIKPDFVETYELVNHFAECVKYLNKALVQTDEVYDCEIKDYKEQSLLQSYADKKGKLMCSIDEVKALATQLEN